MSGPERDLVGYQYVVLRCVPRVDREEFVNVGVVLYCQRSDFLGAASHFDRDRLRALWPPLDIEAVASALRTVTAICAGDEEGGGAPARAPLTARFGFLSAPRSTVVQPGPIHGGLVPASESAPDVLEELLDRLVR
jgi:hypothetical protein